MTSGIMEGIEKYFFENLRINLSSLALSKIGNNAALIAGEGKLKVNFHLSFLIIN